MKKIIYLISLFVLCLVSCEEEVPVKELGRSKLVLHCFLSPQYDTIVVYLSRSQPILSSDKVPTADVEYAMVEISNNNQTWIQIPYSKENNCYLLPQSQFPVVEGQTYAIRASAQNFESITSSCTVPFWREMNLSPEAQFVSATKDNPYHTELSISWKDYPNEQNYYAFMRYGEYEGAFYSGYYITDENSELIHSDNGKDGQKMNVIMNIIRYCTLSEFMNYLYDDYDYYGEYDFYYYHANYDSIYVLAIQTDRNCFLYENSVFAYTNGRFGRFGQGELLNVLMVEPTLVYNNIKNGYGVFGAMTFKQYLLNFRQKTVVEVEIPFF